MDIRKFNWPLWLGLLLSLVAFISYPMAFFWLTIEHDIRWINLALFAIAAVLLVIGVRRAFRSGKRLSKIGASIAAIFSVGVLALFILGSFVMGRMLPASKGAPQVGQRAPEFSLTDTSGKVVTLSELIASTPANASGRKGVLLIFYRGYW